MIIVKLELKVLKKKNRETKITGFIMGSGKIYSVTSNGYLIVSSAISGKVENFKKDYILQNGEVGFVKMNQQESGPSGSYNNLLEQKYARAFYRSSWLVTPVVIELFLNSSVLVPVTDLPIFSGNFVSLKLVYYNPDYMHSSQPLPEPEAIPSIFDIY